MMKKQLNCGMGWARRLDWRNNPSWIRWLKMWTIFTMGDGRSNLEGSWSFTCLVYGRFSLCWLPFACCFWRQCNRFAQFILVLRSWKSQPLINIVRSLSTWSVEVRFVCLMSNNFIIWISVCYYMVFICSMPINFVS